MHFFCSQQSFFRLSNFSPSIIAILVSSECVSISSWLGAWVSRPRQPSRARCPKTAEKTKTPIL